MGAAAVLFTNGYAAGLTDPFLLGHALLDLLQMEDLLRLEEEVLRRVNVRAGSVSHDLIDRRVTYKHAFALLVCRDSLLRHHERARKITMLPRHNPAFIV
jgi:hypothetical protein